MYCPPRPRPLPALLSLVRAASEGDGNLLNLLPDYAYRAPLAWLGYSRRSILIVNDPPEVARVLANADGLFPKSDLMVGALEPLVGESMFVSEGKTWSRQRKMIDPAFSHMRLTAAFEAMSTAVDAYERRLNEAAQTRTPVSLDLAMSHLTADIICRTVFTTSLESHVAREVFEDFAIFERSVAEVEIRRLIVDPAWTRVPQKADVLEACQRIRAHLGDLLAPHLSADGETASDAYDDIATALVKARAAGDGRPFTRKELLDQLGVFFLAGHETTASVLTWVFFIVATQPAIAERMREEIHGVVGSGPVTFEHTKKLPFLRAVFRETLRLYPPITFLPRVAAGPTRIGRFRVRRGALIMISPWTIHRNPANWPDPDAFDPDRFMDGRDRDAPDYAYIPFGKGPRICIGAGFATVESALILARLIRAFDFEVIDPAAVKPVARLTTRPKDQIMARVTRRSGAG